MFAIDLSAVWTGWIIYAAAVAAVATGALAAACIAIDLCRALPAHRPKPPAPQP